MRRAARCSSIPCFRAHELPPGLREVRATRGMPHRVRSALRRGSVDVVVLPSPARRVATLPPALSPVNFSRARVFAPRESAGLPPPVSSQRRWNSRATRRRWRCIASRAPSASCASSAATIASWSVSVFARSAGVWKCASIRVQSSPPRRSHRLRDRERQRAVARHLGDQHVELAIGGVALLRHRRHARASARSSRAARRYPTLRALRAASAAISPSIIARAARRSNGPGPSSSAGAALAVALRRGRRPERRRCRCPRALRRGRRARAR